MSMKQLKAAEKTRAAQETALTELAALAKDIERSEKTISGLKSELAAINAKYQGERTTREDIAYLTALLECAKKKLAWEKQMASLQKRTPVILDTVLKLMHDTNAPPTAEMQAEMLRVLQTVQAALERLNQIKMG